MENNYPNLGSAKLSLIFFKKSHEFATLNEYAKESSIPVNKIITLLEPYLDTDVISLEAYDGEVYLNTAPKNIPGGPKRVFPPNLWEILRKNGPVVEASRLYKLYRGLLYSGWVPKVREKVALEPTPIKILLGDLTVPLLDSISLKEINYPDNIISQLEYVGVNVVALISPDGGLDNYVTAVRNWYLNRTRRSEMDIIVLEAPRYTPIILTSDDSAINPISITLDKGTERYIIVNK